jgi:hypothetical protein
MYVDELEGDCNVYIDMHAMSRDVCRTLACRRSVGIVRGNPGVFQLNPYPTPEKPLPPSRVRVLEDLGKGF